MSAKSGLCHPSAIIVFESETYGRIQVKMVKKKAGIALLNPQPEERTITVTQARVLYCCECDKFFRLPEDFLQNRDHNN